MRSQVRILFGVPDFLFYFLSARSVQMMSWIRQRCSPQWAIFLFPLLAVSTWPDIYTRDHSSDRESPSRQVTRLWERAVADRTEQIESLSEATVVRIGSRTIDGYNSEDGQPKWSVTRDGALSVLVEKIPGSSNIVVLRNFDRPPPLSGLRDGSSYSLHYLNADSGDMFWNTGIVSGQCQSAQIIAEKNRIVIILRSDSGVGSIDVLSLMSGQREWDLDLGEIEEVDSEHVFSTDRHYSVISDGFFRVDRRERMLSVSSHDLENGDLKWVAYFRGEGEDLRLTATGELLFATGGMSYRIDRGNGSVQWNLDDPWLPVKEQNPWLLTLRSDGGRIQLIHRNSGEERWRSSPRIASGNPMAICWTQDGILVGESRGRTTLWGMVDGRRIARESNRYRAPSRNDYEYAKALSSGMLFVQVGSRGSEVLRVNERGETSWSLQIAAPPRSFLSSKSLLTEDDLFHLSGAGSDGDPTVLWLVTSLGGNTGIQMVDLRAGRIGGSVQINSELPAFSVDSDKNRIFFIDADGMLVASRF